MSKAKSKEPLPPTLAEATPDPRAVLATAISRYQAAMREEEVCREAVSAVQAAVTRSKDSLNCARDSAQKEKERQIAKACEYAKDGEGIYHAKIIVMTREVELAAIEALGVVEAAQKLREDALTDAEYRTRKAHDEIVPLARAAAAAELPRLIADTRAIQDDLVHRRLALRTLVREINCDFRRAPETEDAIHLLRDANFPMTTGCTEYTDWNNHPDASRWKGFIIRLMEDADAALPD